MKLPDFSKIRAKLKNRRTILPVGAIVVLIVVILILQVGSGAPNIATYEATRDEFIIDIRTSGELEAEKSVSVSVPRMVRGGLRIVGLAEDGSMVEKGDFLVQFDTSEAARTVEERQNELENAKAELASQNASISSTMKQLESAYETQKYSYEQAKIRYEQMKYEAEAKRREQELNLKKAELALEQARQKIESQKIIDQANTTKAELKVKQAELHLKQATEELNSLTLTAPKGGLVVLQEIWGTSGRAKVKVGDTPWRGMELVQIPDLSVMLTKTKVNEVDISRVAPDQQVLMTMDAISGPTFYGKVTNVATLARREQGSDVKVFDVEVKIEGSDPRLKPGMTAQCQIVTDKIDSVLHVPLESVFEKNDTTVVYVKNGGFELRPVKVGAKNSDYIIIEDGLSEGEKVALHDPTLPLEELGEQAPVVPEKRKPKQDTEMDGMIIIGG